MRVTANSMSKKSMGGLDETKKTIIEGVDPSQFEDDIIDEEEETGVDVVAIKEFVDQLLEGREKDGIRFEELEDRVQRMELNTGVREQLVRKGNLKQFQFVRFNDSLLCNSVK